MRSQPSHKPAQRGFTLVEVSIVIVLIFFSGIIVFRTVGTQSSVTAATANQIYQTSQVLANNWKRLSQAAGVPYNLGNAYWTADNPLLACAASACTTSGVNGLDGQRAVRVLAEGQSAMNPAYASAWGSARLSPMLGLQKVDAYYYLQGSLKVGSNISPYVWGSGYAGASYWAMGPIIIYYPNGITEAVAVELAQRYAGVAITAPGQTQITGPVHFWSADSGGTGFRAVALVFP